MCITEKKKSFKANAFEGFIVARERVELSTFGL